MRLELVRSPTAKEDLLEIWDYIARDSERAADRMLDRITTTLNMVLENPFAGGVRPELADGLRSIGCGSYVVFYRVTDVALVLVRVRSGYLDTDQIDFS